MKPALSPLILMVLATSGFEKAFAEPITVIDQMDPARIASCAHAETRRERRECIFRDANATDWYIQFYEGRAAGTTAEGRAAAAVKTLQPIVERCGLGKTFYTTHTDGMASLHIGDPGLSEEEIACIKAAEQDGLMLRPKT